MAQKNPFPVTPLKPGEIEVTWLDKTVQRFQTQGQTFNGQGLVLTIDSTHNVVIPLSSMRYFRIPTVRA